MNSNNLLWFKKGIKTGLPISLGYFAVAFTLGIAAKNAGFTAFQAMLTSFLINASAGEFVGFTLIASGASYIEVAVMELIANARYLLMSTALSQKISEDTPLIHRLIIGYDVTDEIFGASILVNGKLNPFYMYGMILIAVPGWSLGTYLGVLMGNVLPINIVSALSVGLYGMFIAVIIPPAKNNKKISLVIIVSMFLSFIFEKISIINISSGMRTIILTVLLSGAFAILFPIKEEKNEA